MLFFFFFFKDFNTCPEKSVSAQHCLKTWPPYHLCKGGNSEHLHLRSLWFILRKRAESVCKEQSKSSYLEIATGNAPVRVNTQIFYLKEVRSSPPNATRFFWKLHTCNVFTLSQDSWQFTQRSNCFHIVSILPFLPLILRKEVHQLYSLST